MTSPAPTPTKANPATEQTRQEIQQSLHQTRSTMARQELLKRLWHLESNEPREPQPPASKQSD